MSNDTSVSNQVGIYNDLNNVWMQRWYYDTGTASQRYLLEHKVSGENILYSRENAETNLYYDNAWKISTRSNGARIVGNVQAERYCDESNANCFERHTRVRQCPAITGTGGCSSECVGQLTTSSTCKSFAAGCVSGCNGKDPQQGCVATTRSCSTWAGYLVN